MSIPNRGTCKPTDSKYEAMARDRSAATGWLSTPQFEIELERALEAQCGKPVPANKPNRI